MNLINLMKRAALFVAFMAISIGMSAQNVTLKVDNKPLKDVLTSITQSTGYKFVYSNVMSDKLNTAVSLNCSNDNIGNVLGNLLKGKGISYTIQGKNIALTLDEISPKGDSGQIIKVSGKVIDEQGEGLPGVYVQCENGKNTVSDLDGNFSFEVPANSSLTFQFMGMLDATAKADGKKNMTVVMKSDMVALDEVVVTGYQSISKERATGSFNIIKTEQLEKPATNIAQRLVGTTTGLQSTTDADGNVNFEIRGQSSLLANAQPLVVVDGFPTQDGFNSVNPNDVESVSVLKDAAAASIWGAKSANGVIVITTKKGANLKKGDVKVDVQAFWKVAPKMDLDYMMPNASTAEILDYEKKGWNNGKGFFGSGYWLPNEDNYQDWSTHSLAVNAMNEHRLGFMTEAEMNAELDRLTKVNNRDQLKKYLLDNPFTHQYNVNVSGATERSNHVLSLMYERQNKSIIGNDQNKYNVGYRTTVKLFKWLDFHFNGNYSMTDADNNGNMGDLENVSPYEMLVNEDGSLVRSNGNYYMPNFERNIPYKSFPYDDWTSNVIEDRNTRNFSTKRAVVRAQGGLTAKIIKGLTLDTKFQYERIDNTTKNIYEEQNSYVRSEINQASSWDHKNGKITANLPKGGFLDQNKSSVDSWNWRNQASFDRGFNNDKHQVSVILGTEISSIITQSTNYARTYGYNDEKLTVGQFPNGVGGSGQYKLTDWMGYNKKFGYTHGYSYATEKYFSLFANASYTFNKKYTISGSARTDASNLITDDPKYRYAPFWSVGLSWNATEENFIKEAKWLDRLIVRATYGYNGNVDRSTSFMPLISVNTTQNSYIQDFTASVQSYGNPTLRWEKTGSFDFGIDFSMFKGKFYGKIDAYTKRGKDLIVSMSIPSTNGTTSQKLNAAKMNNSGVELELGSSLNISGRNITWTGGLNFSYNHNEITELFKANYGQYDLYEGGTSAYVQGYNANTLWSYRYAGMHNVGSEQTPIYKPVVHGADGTFTQMTSWASGDARDYMVNSGTLVAPFTAGLTSTFKIYNFDISFVLTGKFGHVFRGMSFNYPAMTHGAAIPNKLYSELMNADPEKMIPIPFEGEERYYFWDRYYPYMDYLVQKANHIRLQELSITYNVPQKILQRLRMSKASIYAQGNNLAVTKGNKYKEDPEFVMGTLRPTATFTFGINFTF